MANNVKSCKKFNEKAPTAKFTVFAREISSVVLKAWKTRKTNANYSKFSNTISCPGWHHVKEHVLSFPKMWYFLGVRLFKGELLAVKVKSNFKKKNWVKVGVKK